MRVGAAVFAWASVLSLASQAEAQPSPSPLVATQREDAGAAVLVKDKDLSRLPAQPPTGRPARRPSIWEEVEAPDEGRGLDPVYTYSNEASPDGGARGGPEDRPGGAPGQPAGAGSARSGRPQSR